VYGKGIDEILMRYDPTLLQNQTFYYQQDHEGSVTHLTDGNGAVIEKYRYDAFGMPTILDPDGVTVRTASIVSNRFLFTGREYAANFGFYEYRARAYHPALGRFMSEDPKVFVRRAGLGKAPDDWSFAKHPDEGEFNLFRYCGNDPIDKVDPLGLLEFVFDKSFPQDAQARFLEAKNLGASTSERGKFLANLPGTVKVFSTTDRIPTGADPKTMRLFLNPKDPSFLDSKTRREFQQQFPTELAPSDAKGRAAVIFHEFGHFTGNRDENIHGGHNVRDNENPVRRGLPLDDRESYKGVPVKQHP
jgi:RHS repeat-associated protein